MNVGSLAGFGWRGALILDSYGVEAWGCREETDLPGKNSICVPWSLGITTSFIWCWFVWIRFWGPCAGPCGVILKLCVCVCMFPQDMFPLTQHKSTENFLNTSCHTAPCLYITWFFPQLSHSSSLVNIHFPQKDLLLKNGPSSWLPKWKSQTEDLRVVPVCLLWTPDLNLSLSFEILVMEQGGPCIYIYAWMY